MPKRWIRKLAVLLLALLASGLMVPASAPAQADQADRADRTPSPASEVFKLAAARTQGGDITLSWTIAPGHYLYRDKISAALDGGKALPVRTQTGVVREDPTFGTTEIYRDSARATLAAGDLPGSGVVRVRYQGCAAHGICYPPVTQTVDLVTLAVADDKHAPGAPPAAAVATSAADAQNPAGPSPARPDDTGTGLSARMTGSLPAMLAAFLGFGLLLSLTPCVFPMIPILSGMLAGAGGKLSPGRGLTLSGAYVLAMALAYAALGVVAAWSGRNLQHMLQTPWAVGLMSLVFVGLALSMFGLYDLELPASWTARLAGKRAGRGPVSGGGSVGGAALLGFGSALVVGPCVTPPLAAALLYVAQTGDTARGASALFALGLGMGLPLLAFGTFGARLLPKSGPWLVTVKKGFGLVFLGLAVWMAGRALPQGWTGAPGTAWPGARPAATADRESGQGPEAGFLRKVTTPEAFDQAMAEARAQGRPILVDFTAGWCLVCREIDDSVMADPSILPRLKNISVIRADITADTGSSRELMRRFGVVGPPTMLFVDARTGREIENTRTIGAVSAGRFGLELDHAGA